MKTIIRRRKPKAGQLEIWLPKMFILDHAERDLPTGHIQKIADHSVLLLATKTELMEILNDAEYYADATGGPDCLPIGLRYSARKTVTEIKNWLCI